MYRLGPSSCLCQTHIVRIVMYVRVCVGVWQVGGACVCVWVYGMGVGHACVCMLVCVFSNSKQLKKRKSTL